MCSSTALCAATLYRYVSRDFWRSYLYSQGQSRVQANGPSGGQSGRAGAVGSLGGISNTPGTAARPRKLPIRMRLVLRFNDPNYSHRGCAMCCCCTTCFVADCAPTLHQLCVNNALHRWQSQPHSKISAAVCSLMPSVTSLPFSRCVPR